ncbi:MAG: YdcF family protein [Magnetococcales bacterium]|nr:YdcF family protein [Magnetococcales bacterium]
MNSFINMLIERVFLPPGLTILLTIIGLIWMRRHHKQGVGIIVIGLIVNIFFTSPIIVGTMGVGLMRYPALSKADLDTTSAQAIVILGCGRFPDSQEYWGDTLKSCGLNRVRYGAWVQRHSGLPILVTGGCPHGHEPPSEAILMQRALQNEFQVPVRWLEKNSRNTFENARFTAKIFQENPLDNGEVVTHILLVTHAMHMPRAVEAFEQAGLTVTAAPTLLINASNRIQFTLPAILPSAQDGYSSTLFIHEYLGRLWYQLHYFLQR